MKTLSVADRTHRTLYYFFDPARFSDIELVISYMGLLTGGLSFLVWMIPVPLMFVTRKTTTGSPEKIHLRAVTR